MVEFFVALLVVVLLFTTYVLGRIVEKVMKRVDETIDEANRLRADIHVMEGYLVELREQIDEFAKATKSVESGK